MENETLNIQLEIKENSQKENKENKKELFLQLEEGTNKEISPKERRKNSGPRKIGLKVALLSLREINLVEQTFTCEIYFEATIYDPSFVGKEGKEIDCSKIVPYLFVNMKEQQKVESWNAKSSKETDYLFYKIKFEGKFVQRLELMNFPFDVQDLNVIISCNRDVKELILERSTHRIDTIKTDPKIDFFLQEYK